MSSKKGGRAFAPETVLGASASAVAQPELEAVPGNEVRSRPLPH